MISPGDVAIRDLYFEYPGQGSAAGGFTLDIPLFHAKKGSVTVLSGPNGSGKTTLLKILAGLIDTESEPNRTSERGTVNAVLVHQTPYLLGGSVERNVTFGLKVRGLPGNERKARAAVCLRAVGLDGFARRRARNLSGGERQRVALARALAVEPDVLLLDEPTASVDRQSVEKLEAIIAEAAAAGTTVIVTSHDAAFTFRVADSLLGIENGSLHSLEDNLIKGKVVRSDDRFSYFSADGGEIRCVVQSGNFRAAVIPYNDIILSTRPIETSAQNQFKGRVTGVFSDRRRFRVDVDCGFTVCSFVTGFSVDSLGVRIGAELYVIFKASSVRLF